MGLTIFTSERQKTISAWNNWTLEDFQKRKIDDHELSRLKRINGKDTYFKREEILKLYTDLQKALKIMEKTFFHARDFEKIWNTVFEIEEGYRFSEKAIKKVMDVVNGKNEFVAEVEK